MPSHVQANDLGGARAHAAAPYVGRFAPSPTGPLHAGSMVAALASWLDARAWQGGGRGQWLVRIEDLDQARCSAGAAALILRQLQACALVADQPVVFQSQRLGLYRSALERLRANARVYPCGCSRKDIETALARQGKARPRHGERVYPGTCSQGLNGKAVLCWRFRTGRWTTPADCDAASASPAEPVYQAAPEVHWTDRRLGPQRQNVAAAVGDFVLQGAGGQFSYQLAVVVDDAAQQVTDVVRGADLADNTARQILLQSALGLNTPRYLHTPLVLSAGGEKLSKQNGAQSIDAGQPLRALNDAALVLGLPPHAGGISDALSAWVGAWRDLYNPRL